MSDMQPYSFSLVKPGATLHLRCGGSFSYSEKETPSTNYFYESGLGWNKSDGRINEIENPFDIIGITPAPEPPKPSAAERIASIIADNNGGHIVWADAVETSIPAIRAILDEADGWIKWEGGENPVPDKYVVVKFRSGLTCHTECRSNLWTWEYIQSEPANNIIAYRVVE